MTPSAQEREEAVLMVLEQAMGPLGPSEIGRRIGKEWCCVAHYGMSAPITPVLRRINAVRHKGGKYTKPEGQGGQQ